MRPRQQTSTNTGFKITNWWKGNFASESTGSGVGKTSDDWPTIGQSNDPDASGWRSPSPYSVNVTSLSRLHGTEDRQQSNGTRRLVTGNLYAAIGFNPPAPFGTSVPSSEYNPSALENLALNKALEKAKRKSFDALVFFAEREQTYGMIASALLSIVQTVRDFRRQAEPALVEQIIDETEDWAEYVRKQKKRLKRLLRKLKDERTRERWKRKLRKKWQRLVRRMSVDTLVKRLGKPWAARWLAVRYGWTPLFADAQGAAEAFETYINDLRPSRFNVTGKEFVVKRFDRDVPATFDGFQVNWKVKYGVNASFFVRLDWETPRPSIAVLSSLGLTNPLTVIWEVTPYSFVADWFLSIGSFLETLDVPLVFKYLGGSGTLRAETQFVGFPQYRPPYSPWTSISVSAVADSRDLIVTRKKYDSPPLGGIEFTLNWSVFTGAKRLADTVALFLQTVK